LSSSANLSVREDILGRVWSEELAVLQNSVEPFDAALALQAIERGLGAPVDDLFVSIETEPVAAASLAQVHRGVLRRQSGAAQAVAVKVLRPGVAERMAADLCVLLRAGAFRVRGPCGTGC
jgi:ubiquinone biosynthesis protein